MDLYTIRQQLNLGIPLTNIKLRVTDYSRVSTDHLEQKNSLKNQVEHFEEMIKSNPNWTYVSGYVDDGISGTIDYKRDNFMQMIEDGKNGKFDLIVTKEISRFSRNTLDSIKYTRELLNSGVAVLFVNDNINTALPDAELRLTIMASMAQDEIRRLSERVKFGMNRSIKNGNILGNDLLYGYKKDKLTGNLYIVESEAQIVRRLFTMYAIEKLSISKIAIIFNNENIKTSLNKKWCTSTLARMLKNPKYKGYYCGRKTEVIDYMTKKVKYIPQTDWLIYEDNIKVPPIISKELWQRANERLVLRKKKFGDNYKDKVMYKNRYPLSAKIYCKDHKEVFHRRCQCTSTNEVTWCCAKYLKEGKKACDSPNIRESEIYSIFKDIINTLSINLQEVTNNLTNLYKNNNVNLGINEQITKYKKDIDKILIKKDKLLELNIQNNLSNIEFNEKNKQYNEELNTIKNNISILEQKRNYFSNIETQNIKLNNILNQLVKSNNTLTKIINLLLEKIIVSKINNEKNNLELSIYLKLSKEYLKKELNQTIQSNIKKFMTNNYEFKRGYNTRCTKRYIIKYQVNLYLSF